MKWVPGLVSISFRSLSPETILQMAKESGLEAIEWGSDIHAPAGRLDKAARIRSLSAQAGIITPEYGSYYILGWPCDEKSADTVASARALGTPAIRLWASDKNRASLSAEEYRVAVTDAERLCRENADLTFCLECHNWSITEDYQDALAYLRDVNCPNLKMFWQPNHFRSHAYNLRALDALLPYLYSVHVFSWEGSEHFPLAHHAERWEDYLMLLRHAPTDTMYLMLEFMHDNDPASLLDTARTLRSWIAQTEIAP